jgi:putative copper export protein/mono/diheme cytochrome c family protein
MAEAAMAIVRGLGLAAILSLLGTAVFIAWVLPTGAIVPSQLDRRLRHLWWLSALVAMLAGIAWFGLQASGIAGSGTLPELLDALPLVAAHTRFGNIVMIRLGLLLGILLLAMRSPALRLITQSSFGPYGSKLPCPAGSTAALPHRTGGFALYLALVMTAGAIGLQAVIGHAGATAGQIGNELVVSEFLHLVAAGIWLGGLLPLWLSLSMLSPADAAATCERFSPLGLACVLILGGTGLVQGLTLIGGLPALFGTQYGHVALVKIAMFLLLLVLAALNRLRLTDRLAAARPHARRNLLLSVALETCLGLGIVLAAAAMASSVPAIHATPVWPFSWQFSLSTVKQDADLRRDVVISVIVIGEACGLAIAAILARRYRLVASGILALVLALRVSSLRLLTIDAYPTSFQTSPTHFSSTSIARGSTLFSPNCASCHGADGHGNGPAASALRIKPADLTVPHLWEHSDGEMFWWLGHGVADPEGGLAMPGFGTTLSAEDLWALIDYMRARNAGLAIDQEAAFNVPIHAPAMPITCSGVTASSIDDLKGHVVRVVAGPAGPDGRGLDQAQSVPGISIVVLDLRNTDSPAPEACVATDPSGWQAYAILANLPPERLEGSEFLIDPNLWLRAVYRRGTTPGRQLTRDSLTAAIRRICSIAVQQPNGDEHDHHH